MTAGTNRSTSPLAALAARARVAPDKTVLICGSRHWTPARLLEDCDRLASALAARGVRPGDRVALHMLNIAEAVIAYLACFRIGAIATPLNTRFKTAELSHWIERTTPAIYLGQGDLYENFADVPQDLLPDTARYVVGSTGSIGKARTWVELMETGRPRRFFAAPDPDAAAVLLATSGTTSGRGKLVVWTHRTLASFGPVAAARGPAGEMVFAVVATLMHTSGMVISIISLIRDFVMVLIPRFDPDMVLDAIEHHRCTSIGGLPFMYAALAQRQKLKPRDVACLRACTYGGDTCATEIAESFEEQFGVHLRSIWAATEEPGVSTPGTRAGPYFGLVPEAEFRVMNEAGNPVPDGETGEMWLRSPTTAPGYWESPGVITSLPDGFFHSGDLVRVSGEREVQYIGRKKDLIVRGGSKISPLEVEAVLQDHPNVREVAVVGLPDPVLGQRVGALLVLKDGADAAPILAAAKKRLADHKVPEIWAMIDKLPRNALTKIDRNAVAEAIAKDGERLDV
ncbi:class I adenylate-forming enzyme family protein [Paraburkholderia solisilvae]|uniref:Long-chain-fatty-acid--CoA ligase n=1 Tax=Paraburkholderia solisilvae TaxID=624376 RepID=A0A6J5D7G7_9BURK|nr:class I adenylate-forming enzyme family protein [Paraburkholderia solisilvae]CAB3750310.1 Long-chain-fatty-acid--CoA ligase [Paraburkholderia solisilvae]